VVEVSVDTISSLSQNKAALCGRVAAARSYAITLGNQTIGLFVVEGETPLSAAIMLLGTLVPIAAASVFYIGDRRAARHRQGEITWVAAESQAPAEQS
jgi:hypothetical protein